MLIPYGSLQFTTAWMLNGTHWKMKNQTFRGVKLGDSHISIRGNHTPYGLMEDDNVDCAKEAKIYDVS